MFDTHCHLNFKAFADDAPNIANAMARDYVSGMVVGCDNTTSRYAIDLAQTFPNLWASVGLHPTHVFDDPWDELLMKELAVEDRVLAIGEVGLDFDERATARVLEKVADKQTTAEAYFETQHTVFQVAIDLAKLLHKPLIIHSRAAYDEIISVLEKNFIAGGELSGTVHCFMGNWTQAQAILDRNFMLGFTGVITYADASPDLLDVVSKMPEDRILIETDAPYLTPEPYRSEGKRLSGKVPRNLPQYVLEVAKKIGEVRGMKMMDVVQLTEANAKRLFNID